MNWQSMVREFHEKFGQPVGTSPKLLTHDRFSVRDEWECSENMEKWDAQYEDNLPGVADGIVDQLYFLIGTAVEMGIDLDPLFKAVHAANMKKVYYPEQSKKVQKPMNWVAPDIAGELAKQGWVK